MSGTVTPSDYENLKELLQAGPHGLTEGEIMWVMWTAFEVIDAQEKLIAEYDHHIDNAYTSQDIRSKCVERYSSILRPMAS